MTYEHFRPEFANATAHEADGICLLCPRHHYGKGIFVSREAIDRARAKQLANPRPYAAEPIDIGVGFPRITVATITGEGCSVLLHVDGEDVISILPPEEKGGPYRVNARLRDAAGNVILEIVENELRSPSTNWDFEFKGSTLIVRSRPRHIALKAELEPGSGIRFDEFRCQHGAVWLRAADGWLRGVTPTFAFEARDFNVIREGGTVLHVEKGQFIVGKAPTDRISIGSMTGGSSTLCGVGSSGYDKVAALVRTG